MPGEFTFTVLASYWRRPCATQLVPTKTAGTGGHCSWSPANRGARKDARSTQVPGAVACGQDQEPDRLVSARGASRRVTGCTGSRIDSRQLLKSRMRPASDLRATCADRQS